LLLYGNPVEGRVFSRGSLELAAQLFVPWESDTGRYLLVGHVGRFPIAVVTDDTLELSVIE